MIHVRPLIPSGSDPALLHTSDQHKGTKHMKLTNVLFFILGGVLLIAGIGALASVALRLLWPALLLGVGVMLIGKAVKSPSA